MLQSGITECCAGEEYHQDVAVLRFELPEVTHSEVLLEAAGEMHACCEWQLDPPALAERFDTLIQELAAARDAGTEPPDVLPYTDYWLFEVRSGSACSPCARL